MKKVLLALLLLCGSLSIALADDKMPAESVPDEQLTKEQATFRIQAWQSKIADLQDQLNKATADNDKLKKQLDDAIASLKNCNEDLYRLIGANAQDVDNFRQRLGVLEGKTREMKKLSDDQLADKSDEIKALEDQLNAMRGEKIAVLPEFFDRIVNLAREIKGLYREKKIKGYTVGAWSQTRDCLWNIAGKMEIYGDPFQWPKIWQANTDIIKNPDMIHPGQVLKIIPPGPKTPEEMKAERKYWRQKRARAQAAEEKKAEKGAPQIDKKVTPAPDAKKATEAKKPVEKKSEPKGN